MKTRQALLCCAVLLAACGDTAHDGEYTWRKSDRPGAERYEWYRVGNPHTDAGCAPDSVGCAWLLGGHTSGERVCLVYSYYNEADARKLYIGQSRISHFDHEVGPGSMDGKVNLAATKGHCAGNSHQDRSGGAT